MVAARSALVATMYQLFLIPTVSIARDMRNGWLVKPVNVPTPIHELIVPMCLGSVFRKRTTCGNGVAPSPQTPRAKAANQKLNGPSVGDSASRDAAMAVNTLAVISNRTALLGPSSRSQIARAPRLMPATALLAMLAVEKDSETSVVAK